MGGTARATGQAVLQTALPALTSASNTPAILSAASLAAATICSWLMFSSTQRARKPVLNASRESRGMTVLLITQRCHCSPDKRFADDDGPDRDGLKRLPACPAPGPGG